MAASRFSMSSAVVVAGCTRGRRGPDVALEDRFFQEHVFPYESETLCDEDIRRVASEVLGLASRNQGHGLTPAYAAEHDGANAFSVVTIDTQLRAKAFESYMYPPTTSSGYKLFKTRENIMDLLEATHDSLDADTAGTMELHVYMAKFKDLDCILVVPDSVAAEHPKLIRELGLDTLNDGMDNTILMDIRVCDGQSLGKSAPYLSIGRFKFLFPGVAMDMSQVRQKERVGKKRPAPKPLAVNEQIISMLDDEYRVHGRAKRLLYTVARKFVETMHYFLDEHTFNEKMAGFTSITPAVVLSTLGNVTTCHTLATDAVVDVVARDRVIDAVQTMHEFMTYNRTEL